MTRSEKCLHKQKYCRQSRPNWKPALYSIHFPLISTTRTQMIFVLFVEIGGEILLRVFR